MDPMDEIRQTFFQECEEQLAELHAGLRAIEAGDADPETVNVVFRAVHSIKGGAGAFSLAELVKFAWTFEKVLDGLRLGKFTADPALMAIMTRAADLLTDLVRSSRDSAPADPSSLAFVGDLAQAITDRTGGVVDEPAPAGPAFEFQPLMIDLSDFGDLAATPTYQQIRFKPRADLYAKGNDTAILMRELSRLGTISVTCDVSGLPLLGELDPEGAYFAWTADLRACADPAAITEVFDFVEWDSDLSIEELVEPDEAAPPAEAVAPRRPSKAGRRKSKTAGRKRSVTSASQRHKSSPIA